ncbi:MAG: WbuC family cupin fold metalloprotein, partial [Bacteroidales bacterium]
VLRFFFNFYGLIIFRHFIFQLPLQNLQHWQLARTSGRLHRRLKVFFHDSDGRVSESFLLDPLEGQYGVHIPAGQWHSLEVLQSGSVIFEVKDGPYEPLGEEDMQA